MEITKEMFDMDQTQITSIEELEMIAKKCPVLVNIERSINIRGEFERKIYVFTAVYAKTDKKIEHRQCITNCLIEIEDRKADCFIRGSFKTLEEAEQWVGERINEIRNKRKMIIESMQKEKPSEFVIIE